MLDKIKFHKEQKHHHNANWHQVQSEHKTHSKTHLQEFIMNHTQNVPDCETCQEHGQFHVPLKEQQFPCSVGTQPYRFLGKGYMPNLYMPVHHIQHNLLYQKIINDLWCFL